MEAGDSLTSSHDSMERTEEKKKHERKKHNNARPTTKTYEIDLNNTRQWPQSQQTNKLWSFEASTQKSTENIWKKIVCMKAHTKKPSSRKRWREAE